jgi:hypothetical protein
MYKKWNDRQRSMILAELIKAIALKDVFLGAQPAYGKQCKQKKKLFHAFQFTRYILKSSNSPFIEIFGSAKIRKKVAWIKGGNYPAISGKNLL